MFILEHSISSEKLDQEAYPFVKEPPTIKVEV